MKLIVDWVTDGSVPVPDTGRSYYGTAPGRFTYLVTGQMVAHYMENGLIVAWSPEPLIERAPGSYWLPDPYSPHTEIRERLARFGANCLRTFWNDGEPGDMNGAELQHDAHRMGLIEQDDSDDPEDDPDLFFWCEGVNEVVRELLTEPPS